MYACLVLPLLLLFNQRQEECAARGASTALVDGTSDEVSVQRCVRGQRHLQRGDGAALHKKAWVAATPTCRLRTSGALQATITFYAGVAFCSVDAPLS